MPKIVNSLKKNPMKIEEGQYYTNEDGDFYLTAVIPDGSIMLINIESGNRYMNTCATDWSPEDFVDAGFFRVYPESITFA